MSKGMKQIAFILAIIAAYILLVLSPPASGQDQKVVEWTGNFEDGRIITKEDLSKILEEHRKWVESDGKEGQMADLSRAHLEKANLQEADLSRAHLEKANLQEANLWRANLQKAHLDSANLQEAKLLKANLQEASLWGANLQKADLWEANLQRVHLRRANLKRANLSKADLGNADARFADFTSSILEPKNIEGLLFLGAKGLSTAEFNNFAAAVKLRKIAKESGFRSEERALTSALRKYRLNAARGYERIFEYIFLDLPSDSGANPWRSLATLFLLIPAFSIPYMVVLRKQGEDGIWKVWIPERVRKDLGEKEPVRLTLRGSAILGVGIYFSVLSAFSIGWRELNVGNWIARIQPREYTLRASGWVRTLSGIQSLISVYLTALWLLTYFGRPFE